MKFQVSHAGTTVHCEISLCCLNTNYGLQVKLSLDEDASNAASVFIHDKAKTAFNLDDAIAFAVSYLNAKGIAELQSEKAKWEANYTKYLAHLKSQEDKEARLERDMKKEGWTHKVTAVIHLPEGGDDIIKRVFFKGEPTRRHIRRLMKRSVVKDSFSIVEL